MVKCVLNWQMKNIQLQSDGSSLCCVRNSTCINMISQLKLKNHRISVIKTFIPVFYAWNTCFSYTINLSLFKSMRFCSKIKHKLMHVQFVLHSQRKLTCSRVFRQCFVYKTWSQVQYKLKKKFGGVFCQSIQYSFYIRLNVPSVSLHLYQLKW